MNFPKYSPERFLSYDDSYEGNVRCYGNPPKGYRWLKVDDRTTKNTLMVMSDGFATYNSFDRRHPRKVVVVNEWPAIEPVKVPKAKANPTIKAAPKVASTPKVKTEVELLRERTTALECELADLKAWKAKVLAATI